MLTGRPLLLAGSCWRRRRRRVIGATRTTDDVSTGRHLVNGTSAAAAAAALLLLLLQRVTTIFSARVLKPHLRQSTDIQLIRTQQGGYEDQQNEKNIGFR